jgi:hypothetical protein
MHNSTATFFLNKLTSGGIWTRFFRSSDGYAEVDYLNRLQVSNFDAKLSISKPKMTKVR